MKLSRLLADITPLWVSGAGECPGRSLAEVLAVDPEVTSLHYRAQEVRPGGLFVAIAGFARDGHDFIGQAAGKGAVAVLSQKSVEIENLTVVAVKSTRRAMAQAAARFYGRPCGRLTVVGITGTNGKTTTASLLENMLAAAGTSVGVIGTLNCRYVGRQVPLAMTTPESLDLQRLMAEMRAAGVTHVVMEVSSHALDLCRIDACDVDLAVFTNLSRDHLDYHGDMASYWSCKKRLFTDHLKAERPAGRPAAVVNSDDPHGRELLSLPAGGVLSTGTDGDVRPGEIAIDLNGIRGTLQTPAGPLIFASSLIGRHNLENIMSAVGAALALGIDRDRIRQGIETLVCVPGRLERVPDPAGRLICVDYAHTPDALENALKALRELTGGRLVCVFGCGGDRDRGKRRQMGAIAGRYADLAVVTSDNPRSEPPMAIIEEILPGVRESDARERLAEDPALRNGSHSFVVDPDRAAAITLAVSVTRPGDALLIAGKGHETYQIVGSRTLPFDDRRKAREALRRLGKEAVS
jgi:UDP-N-acetylmuramyl-tripeptide synthetase